MSLGQGLQMGDGSNPRRFRILRGKGVARLYENVTNARFPDDEKEAGGCLCQWVTQCRLNRKKSMKGNATTRMTPRLYADPSGGRDDRGGAA